MRLRNMLAFAVVGASAADVHVARAQATSTSATAAAETLFSEGRRLMGEGKFDAACPKFEGAQKVAPTPGTLINLANCYEKAGRLASAWVSFREAIALSRVASRTDLAENAQRRATALEPRLAKLSITVTSTAPDLEVTSDGTVIPHQAWATPVPVDPGEHVVEATAPGRKPFRIGVVAPASGATQTVNVPELEMDPAAQAAAAPAPPTTRNAGGAAIASPMPQSESEAGRGSTQRSLAFGAGALGVVGVVVGSVFAARASSKYSDSKGNCRVEDPNRCSTTGKELRDDARSAGNIATVGIGVGAVLLGTGAVLFFTAPKNAPSASTVAVAVAPTLGGLLVKGTFR